MKYEIKENEVSFKRMYRYIQEGSEENIGNRESLSSVIRRIHCLVLRVQSPKRKSGGDSKEDPPVSMPNTEVKLLNVDDTWRATARESRKLPDSTFGGNSNIPS